MFLYVSVYIYSKLSKTKQINYSILLLVRAPGDRRNLLVLSGVRINWCLKYLKALKGTKKYSY